MKKLIAIALVAACGGKSGTTKKDDAAVATPGDARVGGSMNGMHVTLKPPPPLPEVPTGLPARPETPDVTPELVSLGELLFYEPRLSASGKTSCATCHDPATGFGGGKVAHQNTDAGKPNLRHAPALVNLAWKTSFGWDGRYASVPELLSSHVKGQLGGDLVERGKALQDNGIYAAHFDRAHIDNEGDLIKALAAYVLTRYSGDAPWDKVERTPDQTPAELRAGYQLFTTKAGCATCHVPPLYTDNGFHALGLIAIPDEGRGKVDPAAKGAFATPTLRGAAARGALFHDGSAATLDAAIDWHLDGGTGQKADPSIIDKGLSKIALTAKERADLGAFVKSLTPTGPAPTPPQLPK